MKKILEPHRHRSIPMRCSDGRRTLTIRRATTDAIRLNDALVAWVVCISILFVPSITQADVADELAAMLAEYPDADQNRDGTLTEQEAGRYILRRIQKKRANRGTGIGNRELLRHYEAHEHDSMPYRLMKPENIEAGKTYPLIVSLHGSGGVGNDNLSNLRFWNGVLAKPEMRSSYPCFVLAPQRRPGGYWGAKPADEAFKHLYVRNELLPAFEIIERLKTEYPIDSARIYALGSSGGGVGTWNILLAKPEMFAAAIPVCGRFRAAGDDVATLAKIPIWCFHGDADPQVDVENSRRAFNEIKQSGGSIKYTELRAVKHNSWIQAFNYTGDDPSKGFITRSAGDAVDPNGDVWQWLFSKRKTSGR